MANNIRIIGSILNTTTVNRYSEEDKSLFFEETNIQENFGGNNDYIEYYIYDVGGNLLGVDYDYFNYKLSPTVSLTPSVVSFPNTTGEIQTNNIGITSILSPQTSSLYPVIEIDPIKDLQNSGYSSGEFSVRYNLFQNVISNFNDQDLFIKEISQDRTEIRLASITLSDIDIEQITLSLIEETNNSDYYVDYLLNFGDNKQYSTINVALNKNVEGYEILFKLYEPLPLDIQVKQKLWVVKEKTNSYVFEINLDKIIIPPPPPSLRGPNFDIPINSNQGTISTTYQSYQSLISNLQLIQNNSYKQILNLLNTQSVQININYIVSESLDFGNFVFFGSAYQRLTNFYTKVKEIEDYNNFINSKSSLTSSTPSLIIEINQYTSSINNIISKFDGYESYLYFESSSYTWPKSGSLKPYILFSTSSISASNWYTTQSLLAQNYDLNNYNNLEYAIPTFIKDDESNQPFLIFLNMVGHYFDNIWIYLQAITDINLANNNLNKGISKDLVYEQLKSLGIKLYNSQAGEDVNQYLIGANTGSSTWNNNVTITGSYLNNIPRKDLVSELYKRIYHNLPLLLKQKGTVEGLNSLMTVFGIPNKTYYTIGSESFYTPTGSSITASILNVKEYGGSLKSNLIKGYNNDKVRIVSNTLLTGSALSSIVSLQTYPTASSQFRDDDMHYVDISFSPQTQINTYISKSISSSNTTWNIDDYIGDPRYAYSSSYGLLEAEKAKYYQVGVPGYAPFTASALDYNGFIRLIEYFDNALFKMLGDFVPERTSLSTGVTFESPVLERNKAPYAIPSAYTGSVYEGEIGEVGISSEYGDFYDALGSDKKAWYDGDITGSYIDVYNYFENSNPNPYLLAASSSFTTQSIYEFQHSDFNVLLNNVSKSVDSLNRKKIEYVWGTTSSILTTPELQDSYLTLQAHNNSRYNGSKTYGLKYNTYTSASLIIESSINVSYTFISSSYNWDLISGIVGNPYYTTLYLTGSTSQLANIINILNLPEVDSLSISNPDPFIPDSVTNNLYKVYTFQYFNYLDGFNIVYDNTKLALALSPALKVWVDPIHVNTGEQPTITSNYGPGTLNLNFYKNYSGDYSYGKTTSIDRNSYKLGWVRTIQSESLNFNDKTTINLKYLIDSNLQITELSANNNNLFEVQNIFKSNTPLQISVTDVNFPSNQITLDGIKTIFRGGYRFDPILFRENNENLTFVFSNPFSQSIEYIGVKANSNYYYQYNASDETAVSDYLWNVDPARFPYDGPLWQSNKAIAYSYTSNDSKINTNLPIAQRSVNTATWNNYRGTTISGSSALNSTNNKLISSTGGSLPTLRGHNPSYVYLFKLLNFNNTITNTDGTKYESTSEYFYKAPRTSNKYDIKFKVPFYFKAGDFGPGLSGYPGFKPVVIIEKASSLNGIRTVIGVTTISSSFQEATTGGTIYSNPSYNIIQFTGKASEGFYELIFNQSDITLNGGDYLMATFCLIDLSDLFGADDVNGTGNWGVSYFKFTLGGEGTMNGINYTNDIKSSFEIKDFNSPYDIFHYTSSFTSLNGNMFQTSSANSIILLPQATKYISSASIFTPTSDSQKYYTKVLDNFSVQKYDLFRFGAFKDPNPKYYTVTNIQTEGVSFNISTGDFNGVNTPTRFEVAYLFDNTIENIPVDAFAVGDIVEISGTSGGTYDGIVTITEARVFGIGANIQFYAPGLPPGFVFNSPATFTFKTPKYVISFDRNLTETTNVNFGNFAILRPKPDETSVIIDYQKPPGDVSQTLLIPYDANQTLKDKTGDIFEYYNPKLNPNTQNQQT